MPTTPFKATTMAIPASDPFVTSHSFGTSDSITGDRPGARMRLSRWHLVIWFALALLTAAIAVQACLRYNRTAGTDKSSLHIAVIGTAVIAGPLVGPVANPGTLAGPPWVWVWTGCLSLVLLASVAPFVLVRRSVSRVVRSLAWCGFFLASTLWFMSSILSLGHFLS